MAVDHYENFPVASWLLPKRLRPAVVAIYRFARSADDIADEGDALPAQRLAALAQYRLALTVLAAGDHDSARRDRSRQRQQPRTARHCRKIPARR